jgi:hypothetical protein
MTGQTEQQGLDNSTTALLQRPLFAAAISAVEYWVDAWQRSILLLDVLRQRGNNYAEHNARKAPDAARGALPEEGRRRLERIEAICAGPAPEIGRDKAA